MTETTGLEPSPEERQIKIKTYDFKRPEKFSKDHIRTISIIHEIFARLTAISLSSQLRSMIKVRVVSVDALTYEEFLRMIPAPANLAVINMEPLQGRAIMEINPAVTFSVIDRLLGGSGDGINYQHELTDIEISVMEVITLPLFENLREAWKKIIELRPGLDQIETNPQFMSIAPQTELCILVTMEVQTGDAKGMLSIIYPYQVLSTVMDKLNAAHWYGVTIQQKNYTLNNRNEVPVELTAEIFKRDYTIGEITEWNKETILAPLHNRDHCYLRLGDRYVWQCKISEDNKDFPIKIKVTDFAESSSFSMIKEIKMKNEVEKGKNISAASNALSSAKMSITVELGSTTKFVKEVFEIKEGTILELDKMVGEPLDVKANGVLIAKGEAVIIDENFGIQITDIIGNTNYSDQP